ncbi:MAG: hypothetical protein WCX69_05825 [Candidatus Paceibacterota bacterium]
MENTIDIEPKTKLPPPEQMKVDLSRNPWDWIPPQAHQKHQKH